MIVWLASYPRSGNTFLRIVIERLYGRGCSTIYPVDGVFERLGSNVLRPGETGSELGELRASTAVYFVKTHRRREYDVDDADAALYLARDGRDALVSFARQRSEAEPERFDHELRALIDRHHGGTGSWGQNVLSWLAPESAIESWVIVIRFDDLIENPVSVIGTAVGEIAPGLSPSHDESPPSFADLHQLDPAFFRRGVVGTHRDEMPADLEDLFWSYSDNRAAMALLGRTEARPGR